MEHYRIFKKKLTPGWCVLGVLIALCLLNLLVYFIAGLQKVAVAEYSADETIYVRPIPPESGWDRFREYAVSEEFHLYGRETGMHDWENLGLLEPWEDLSTEEVESYLSRRDAWVKRNNGIYGMVYKMARITDAYRLSLEGDYFYLICRTDRGETLLGIGWEDKENRYEETDETCLFILYELKKIS